MEKLIFRLIISYLVLPYMYNIITRSGFSCLGYLFLSLTGLASTNGNVVAPLSILKALVINFRSPFSMLLDCHHMNKNL